MKRPSSLAAGLLASLLAGLLAGLLALAGCSSTDTSESADGNATDSGLVVLAVGASPVPHKGILEFVDENLAADAGIDLDIKEFQDYVQPNVTLQAQEIDANYFQHIPYFDEEVATKNYTFGHGEGIHLEPYGIYSQRIASLDELADGATVAITNDPSNQARALGLLETAGIIKLDESKDSPTVHDIVDNPKNLEFKEAEAPAVPKLLPDVDIAIVNGNYALQNDLVPSKDAIYTEETADNPYVNILAWNSDADAETLEAVRKLDELLHSEEVAQYIKETYPDGEVIPAF